MLRIILIFVAGGCGCLLRYGVAGGIHRLGNGSFPVGTLSVNVIGCILIGFLAALFTGPVQIREDYRLAIVVGLLGGFTTFSSYAYEAISMANGGQFGFAALKVLLSNGLGLAAAWFGMRLAPAVYGS